MSQAMCPTGKQCHELDSSSCAGYAICAARVLEGTVYIPCPLDTITNDTFCSSINPETCAKNCLGKKLRRQRDYQTHKNKHKRNRRML